MRVGKSEYGQLRSLHHGTLLVDTDMQGLQRYLTPDKRKLQAKGIASVGARVLNLRDRFPDISHDVLSQALIDQFVKTLSLSNVHVEDACCFSRGS